ncbi:hypothetical protein [Exiguobacterium sp. s28]|uniref:hypothetical protein n=1 Tax=Exiguobacterium sp. s28 TaxID=2751238 RepID=UPI001BE68DC5|nr:hypothetical protein [Exiguobacterium sp. s28]
MTKSNEPKGSSNLPIKKEDLPANVGGAASGKPWQNPEVIGKGLEAAADISRNISNVYAAKKAHEVVKVESKTRMMEIEESNKTSRRELDNQLKENEARIHESIVKAELDAKQDKYQHKQKMREQDNEQLKIEKEHEARMLEIRNQDRAKSSIEMLEEDYRFLRAQLASNTLSPEQETEIKIEMQDIREKLVSLLK